MGNPPTLAAFKAQERPPTDPGGKLAFLPGDDDAAIVHLDRSPLPLAVNGLTDTWAQWSLGLGETGSVGVCWCFVRFRLFSFCMFLCFCCIYIYNLHLRYFFFVLFVFFGCWFLLVFVLFFEIMVLFLFFLCLLCFVLFGLLFLLVLFGDFSCLRLLQLLKRLLVLLDFVLRFL